MDSVQIKRERHSPKKSKSSDTSDSLLESQRCCVPPAQQPPSVSSTIADRIKSLQEQCSTRASNAITPGSPSGSLPSSLHSIDKKVRTRTPSPYPQQASNSPYSPVEFDEDDNTSVYSTPSSSISSRTLKTESSKDMIEKMSSFLKKSEDSANKYKKKFTELRKIYDVKKAELGVVQDHVKKLRKDEESLTNKCKAMSREHLAEKEQLQKEIDSLKTEMKRLREEGGVLADADPESLASQLKGAKVVLDGLKIANELLNVNVAKLEAEKGEQQGLLQYQQNVIAELNQRVFCLEQAIREDIDDKNMIVNAFNVYMAKTQKRVEKIYERKPLTIPEMQEEQPQYVAATTTADPEVSREASFHSCVDNSNIQAKSEERDKTTGDILPVTKTETTAPKQGEILTSGQKRKEPLPDVESNITNTNTELKLPDCSSLNSAPEQGDESRSHFQKKPKCA